MESVTSADLHDFSLQQLGAAGYPTVHGGRELQNTPWPRVVGNPPLLPSLCREIPRAPQSLRPLAAPLLPLPAGEPLQLPSLAGREGNPPEVPRQQEIPCSSPASMGWSHSQLLGRGRSFQPQQGRVMDPSPLPIGHEHF